MTQLNQIVAVEKGLKARTMAAVNEIDNALTRYALFSGLTRVYTPKTEDGEQLPREHTLVQKSAEEELAKVATALTELFDVTYTKDVANTETGASIEVDGELLAADVPVSFLLFLGKQLNDMRIRICRLPVLSQDETWSIPEGTTQARTEATVTFRTKKVPRNHVRAEATDRHPAQVDVFNEDVIVGSWSAVKFSGAVSQVRRDELVARVDKLIDAVKIAVESANSFEIQQKKIGKKLFDWLLA